MRLKFRKSKLWKIAVNHFFPKADMDTTWLTFGRTVYMPAGAPIDNGLMVHEEVHTKQQKNFLKGIFWWIKYIRDEKFRYSQELPAYKEQFKYLISGEKNRERINKVRHAVAMELSGEHYNWMCDYDQAFRDLK
jgi:hypothetical protein